MIVSIHAPTWGATTVRQPAGALDSCFNPRAHVGRDDIEVVRGQVGCVSIHAPTWGATALVSSILNPTSFQSTRPRGARRATGVAVQNAGAFQSTRPRGARRSFITSLSGMVCFNPRAHVGRDAGVGMNGPLISMFQSTRPRGARLLYFNKSSFCILACGLRGLGQKTRAGNGRKIRIGI